MPKIVGTCSSQRGQTLLVVIIVMVVVLTVGLSLASRNVVNLKTTTEQQNSQKALSAAEAGVEQALVGNVVNNQSLGNATISNVTIQQTAGTSFLLNNGSYVNQDDGQDVWLTTYDTNPHNLYQPPFWNGSLTFYWGSASDVCSKNTDHAPNTMAALEVIKILSSSSSSFNPIIDRQVYDPCSARAAFNHFTVANTNTSVTINGVTPAYATNLMNLSDGVIVRVIPLYANAVIGVVGTKNLPVQGKTITSTGNAGSTQRTISYYQQNDSVPSEFYYSIFSTQ